MEADPFVAFDSLKNSNNKVLANISQQIIRNLCLKQDTGLFDEYDKNKFIKVDISVESNQATAHKTTSFISMATKHFKSIQQLVIMLKYFLHLKDLHVTFKGGLSSYPLTLLVMAW